MYLWSIFFEWTCFSFIFFKIYCLKDRPKDRKRCIFHLKSICGQYFRQETDKRRICPSFNKLRYVSWHIVEYSTSRRSLMIGPLKRTTLHIKENPEKSLLTRRPPETSLRRTFNFLTTSNYRKWNIVLKKMRRNVHIWITTKILQAE